MCSRSEYGTFFRVVALVSLLSAFCSFVFGSEPTIAIESHVSPADQTIQYFFGSACAMSGDYLIVGAPGPDPDSSISSSTPRDAVTYIYSRSGGKYQQSAMISAGTYSSALQDGDNLAISGETVVVGAPREYIYAERTAREYLSAKDGYRDAVYVNTHTPGTTSWPMQAVLRDPNPARNLYFGVSVAIDGDTIVVGAYEASTVAGGGYAHVFRLVYGTWIHETKLNEPTAIEFGRAVAISGETIVVSAPSTSEDIGCAFVYKRVGSDWSRQGTLSGEDELGDFGHSVAISGDTIIVGAPRLSVGAAFIFELTHGSWHKTNSLRPDGADGYVSFGTRVGIDGDIAVISAPGTPSPTGVKCTGKVYMYRMTGSSWAMGAELVDQSSKTYDTLGEAVCVHQDTIVASASYDYVHGTRTGSMSLFTSECPIVKGSYMKPFVECDIPADPGYYVPDDGQLWSTQLPCNGGKWQNLGGQTTCNECPDGTVTPTPGAFTSERSCKAPFPGSVTLGRTTALTTFAAPVSATMDGAPCRVVPGTKVGERSLIVPVVDAMNPGTHTVSAIFNTNTNIQETVDIVIPSDASYPALTRTLDGTTATFLAKYPVCTKSTLTSGRDAALVDVARDGDMPVCIHRATMTVDDIINNFSPAISTTHPDGMACIEYANAEFATMEGITMSLNDTFIGRSSYVLWKGRACVQFDGVKSVQADYFDADVVIAVWHIVVRLDDEELVAGMVDETEYKFSIVELLADIILLTCAACFVVLIVLAPALPGIILVAVLFVLMYPCMNILCLVYSFRQSLAPFEDVDMDEPDEAIPALISGAIIFGLYKAVFETVYLASAIAAIISLLPLCWIGLIAPVVLFIGIVVFAVGFAIFVVFSLVRKTIAATIRIRAERRAIKALADDIFIRASELNARMERHPYLQQNLIDTNIPDTDKLARITVHLAGLYGFRYDAEEFEEKIGIETMKDEDALPTMAAHCKKLMDGHPFVAHKVEAATGHVQKAGLSPFRRAIFSMTDTATPIQAVGLMNGFHHKDTTELVLHPMATDFEVLESREYTQLDTARRATVVASRARSFERGGEINPQEEWAALMQVIGRHTQVMPVFERTNLAHIVNTWDVVTRWAAVDQDELTPRAGAAWTNDARKLLTSKPTWTLTNPGLFSAYVAALQWLVRFIPLFSGEHVIDEEVVAQLRIAATAAVQDEVLLLSMPMNHEEEMARIKKAIKRGKREMYLAENPESDEETEDPAVVRAQLRRLGMEREQLMAGLAHLNEVGFADAPVLPPLENRCEDMMTLAMFEDVRPLAQSNATILAARYNGEAVVLKQYSGGDKKARKKMYNELRTLEAIRHPNVAQIKYAFPDQRMFYLVFDHYKFGDLLDWANDTNPTEGDVLYAAKKTIEAVACLHDHNIIHCDIKPANVFVTATGNPMLGDFDVSKSADGRTMTATVAGSLAYMAPELYTKSDTGEQPRMSAVTDVFSLGRTLKELVYGRTNILNGVIKRMTAEKPYDRPTLVEVLQESAFTDAERVRVDNIAGELANLNKRQEELVRREKTVSAQVKQVTNDMWARHEDLAAEARRIEHLKEERLCMICKERLAVHAYSKCGHVSVCAVCAQPKRCPRCNKKSTKVCYAFKGALSKVKASRFAMMGTTERAEVVRAVVLEYGMVDTVMTLHELLHDYPHLPFHKMDDELMLETLRHMKARGMAVLIPCNDGMGVKFPYGSM